MCVHLGKTINKTNRLDDNIIVGIKKNSNVFREMNEIVIERKVKSLQYISFVFIPA